MTYQYPLSVRYDEEGRPDGLKETLNVVVSSISATNWVGLPAVGGGIAVSDSEVGQIYFNLNDSVASGIPLPDGSGYLFASAGDGEFTYAWYNPPGTGGTPATTLNDLTDVNTAGASPNSVLTYVDSIWVPLELSNNTDLTTLLSTYATTASLANYVLNSTLTNYATTASLANYALNSTLANYVSIGAATAVNQIYYKNGSDSAAGIVAPTQNNTFLKYDGGTFSWATPPGTVYQTGVAFQSPDAASVWFFSSVSGIATSAVSSVGVTKSVFTGPRQVPYSSESGENYAPKVTTAGTAYQVLAVTPLADGVNWSELTSLPALTSVQSEIDTIENNLETVSSNLITVSGDLASVQENYITTAAANAAFVNIAGDTMTGRLELQKGLSAASTCYYDDVVVFRDETEGLSAIDTYFKVSSLGEYPPFNIAPELISWQSYIRFAAVNDSILSAYPEVSSASSNTSIAIGLLDHWLYRHINDFNNPASETAASHWSLAGLRNRTVNLLSATNASALSDINYLATTNTTRHNYVLKWSSSVESWTPQQDVGGKLIGLYIGEDSAPIEPPDDVSLSGNIIVLAGNQEDLLVTEWDISSVIKHLSSTNGIEGSSIHHTLQELDQRYVLVGGDTMSGVLNASALSGVDYIEFDLAPTVDREEGRLYWNDEYKTLELDSANQTSMYLGQEVSIRVINNTGTTLNKGQVVYVSGVNTNVAAVALASASSEGTTHKGVGVLKQSLTTGSRGLMMMFGYLSGINTSGYSSGDILYLGTTPGAVTTTYSPAPNHPELIGSVVNVGTSDSGSILVHVQHGYELQELHNVSRTEPSATGQILVWNETSSIYEPKYNYNTQAFVIENPSATEIPLFYAKHMNGIDEIHSYLIGASSPSVSWTLYTASSISNLTGATELVGDTTDDSSTGVTTAGTQIQNNGWVTLAIDGVIGSVSKLHLTVRTY